MEGKLYFKTTDTIGTVTTTLVDIKEDISVIKSIIDSHIERDKHYTCSINIEILEKIEEPKRTDFGNTSDIQRENWKKQAEASEKRDIKSFNKFREGTSNLDDQFWLDVALGKIK